VGLDAKAVKLDLVLAVVTGRHGVGEDWATGLNKPQEHAQFINEQAGAYRVDRREPRLLLKADAPHCPCRVPTKGRRPRNSTEYPSEPRSAASMLEAEVAGGSCRDPSPVAQPAEATANMRYAKLVAD
jgi:hypothetical protein